MDRDSFSTVCISPRRRLEPPCTHSLIVTVELSAPLISPHIAPAPQSLPFVHVITQLPSFVKQLGLVPGVVKLEGRSAGQAAVVLHLGAHHINCFSFTGGHGGRVHLPKPARTRPPSSISQLIGGFASGPSSGLP